MKQTTLLKFLAAGAAGAVALTALAQTESTTTTTSAAPGGVVTEKTTTTTVDGTGVVSAYAPGTDYIMFRESANAAPARYYYTKKTTLVDPTGRQLEWSALRPDMPVTYTYVREGDRMVVTKVTVNKPVVVEKETTTTTTTSRP